MGVLEDAIREHIELRRRHGAAEEELRDQEAEALGPARRDPQGAEGGQPDETVVGLPPAGEETVIADPPFPAEPAAGSPPVEPVEPATEGADAPFDAVLEDEGSFTSLEPPSEHLDEDPFVADDRLTADPAPPEPQPEPEPVTEIAEPFEEPFAEPEPAPPTQIAEPFEEPEPTEPFEEPLAEPEPELAEPIEEPFAEPEPEMAEPIEDSLAEPGPSADGEHPPPPRGGEDVLEDTPDFLQETPEHDRLWFEQKPPRDFDFD